MRVFGARKAAELLVVHKFEEEWVPDPVRCYRYPRKDASSKIDENIWKKYSSRYLRSIFLKKLKLTLKG